MTLKTFDEVVKLLDVTFKYNLQVDITSLMQSKKRLSPDEAELLRVYLYILDKCEVDIDKRFLQMHLHMSRESFSRYWLDRANNISKYSIFIQSSLKSILLDNRISDNEMIELLVKEVLELKQEVELLKKLVINK